MKCIQIKDSFTVWYPSVMRWLVTVICLGKYNTKDVKKVLNRSWISIYTEWWLHNIGYYITLPLTKNLAVLKLNLRFKDVDLEEWN